MHSVMREQILAAIYEAIVETNRLWEGGPQLNCAPDTILFGAETAFDSHALVHLIVAVEQRVEDAFSVSVRLADSRAVSRKTSPFRSVQSLADYVEERLLEIET
jgi:acyl carrier protein